MKFFFSLDEGLLEGAIKLLMKIIAKPCNCLSGIEIELIEGEVNNIADQYNKLIRERQMTHEQFIETT